ncbi:MAG: PSD1 and planctomycete cytochrome C domain-containing protein [Planctomycetota bacterium]
MVAPFIAPALACASLVSLAAGAPQGAAMDTPAQAADVQFFEAEVRPLLVTHCGDCHSGAKPKGDLDLTSTAALRAAIDGIGLVTAPTAAGGLPSGLLLEAIGYEDPIAAMPPTGKLPDAALATLREWARRGAPLPAVPASAAQDLAAGAIDFNARRAAHWAWQPLADPAPPVVAGPERARDPLDLFLIAAAEAAGVPLAPQAARATWLRRVTYTLTGLPPTPAELDAFERDHDAAAYEHVVDRLLASPHYAERFARHWLDLVRYADTKAHEFDYPIPNAWQYRDYVIRAFDADVPYDRLLIEHIAGDLCADDPALGARLDPTGAYDEAVLGTGWWWLHEEVHSPVDLRNDEADRLANQVDTLTKTALGVTVACARCHDHKFDPIPTEDYYALCGFALSTAYRQVPFEARTANREVGRERAAWLARTDAASRAAVADAVAGYADALAGRALTPDEVARATARGPRSPLYWLALAQSKVPSQSGGDGDGDAQPAARAASLSAALADALAPRDSDPRARPVPVIDYAAAGTAWLQDGEAFGPAPRSAGAVFIGTGAPAVDRQSARARVVVRDCAAADPLWRGLTTKSGAQRNSGEASHVQSGRTLVTPTVRIEGGQVFHLVRGRGTVLAVCQSHRMLAGPLWTESVLHFDTHGAWEYVRHDLKRLVGADARFEFTVADDGPAPGVAHAEGAPADAPPYGLDVAAVYDLAGDAAAPALARGAEAGAWLAARIDEAVALEAPASDASTDTSTDTNTDARTGTSTGGSTGGSTAASVEAAAPAAVRAALRDAAEFVRTGGVAGRALDDAERLALAAAADDVLADLALLDLQGADDITAPLRALDRALAALRAEEAALAARVVRESAVAPASLELEGRDQDVLRRGDTRSPLAPAPRRDLWAVRGDDAPYAGRGEGSGRAALARAWTSPEHPLVARVWVNRLWHHVFGRGLVATVDDFGVTGAAPTHPLLLDRLARDFVADGWSTKHLLRRLVLSDAFRRASAPKAEASERDPENHLLTHMPVRRLDAEAVRDALLSVSGEPRRGALRAPRPRAPDRVHARPRSARAERPARWRAAAHALPGAAAELRAAVPCGVGLPQPSSTRGARSVSNVPAQALALANDPFVIERARSGARAREQRGRRRAHHAPRARRVRPCAATPGARDVPRVLGGRR